MRKVLVVLASAAALVVGAGLTGCTPDSTTEETPAFDSGVTYYELTYATAYVNDEGLITKYTSSEGEEVFEEGFTPTDTIVKLEEQSVPETQGVDISSTIEIEGKPYPVVAWIRITPLPADPVDVISYFNANTATRYELTGSEGIQPPSPPIGLRSIVRHDIADTISQAFKAGQMPGVSFSLTGVSTTNVNAKVAEAHANQLPAWAAYDLVNGYFNASSSYHYVYNCATYGVMSNSDALMATLNSTYKNDVVSYGVTSSYESEINVETAAPCDVVVDNPLPEKDPYEDLYAEDTYQ